MLLVEMTGLAVGVNAGLFFPVSPTTSLGAMFTYELMEIENACVRSADQFESCSSSGSPTAQLVGVTAGVLF